MAFIHIFQEWYDVRASKGGPHGLNAGYWLQHLTWSELQTKGKSSEFITLERLVMNSLLNHWFICDKLTALLFDCSCLIGDWTRTGCETFLRTHLIEILSWRSCKLICLCKIVISCAETNWDIWEIQLNSLFVKCLIRDGYVDTNLDGDSRWRF